MSDYFDDEFCDMMLFDDEYAIDFNDDEWLNNYNQMNNNNNPSTTGQVNVNRFNEAPYDDETISNVTMDSLPTNSGSNYVHTASDELYGKPVYNNSMNRIRNTAVSTTTIQHPSSKNVKQRKNVKVLWSSKNKKKIKKHNQQIQEDLNSDYINKHLLLAKSFAKQLTSLFNKGDMHALGEFYKKNCIEDFQYIEQFKQMKHPLTGEMGVERGFIGVNNYTQFITEYTKGVPDAVMSVRNVEVFEEDDSVTDKKLRVLCKCTSCGTKLKDVEFPTCASAYTKVMNDETVDDENTNHTTHVSNSGSDVSTIESISSANSQSSTHNPNKVSNMKFNLNDDASTHGMTHDQITDSILESGFTLSGTLSFELNSENKIIKVVMTCDTMH